LIRETKKTRSVGVPPGTGLGNTGLIDSVGGVTDCTDRRAPLTWENHHWEQLSTTGRIQSFSLSQLQKNSLNDLIIGHLKCLMKSIWK